MVHLRASLSPNARHHNPPHTHFFLFIQQVHTHIRTHTHTHTWLLFIQQASTVPGTGRFCGRVQGELNIMPILEKYVISCVGSAGELAK